MTGDIELAAVVIAAALVLVLRFWELRWSLRHGDYGAKLIARWFLGLANQMSTRTL